MNEKADNKEFKKQYHIADIGQGGKVKAKNMLESFHIPYYIPSEDPDISPTFGYIFHLPKLVNLIWLPSDSWQLLHSRSDSFPVEYYYLPDRSLSTFTAKQFERFFYVIHREIPGLVIETTGFPGNRENRIRVTGGIWKGFEGVLTTDPDHGYALLIEIPPLFSWLLPVSKEEVEVIAAEHSILEC